MQFRSAEAVRRRPIVGGVLVVLAVLLAVTACGSREPATTSTAGGATVGGNGTGTVATTGGGSGTTVAATPSSVPAANMVGTLKSPCSATKATGPTASAPGVSPGKLTIGVISDRANAQIPVPTVGIQEGMQAFVAYCNSLGGINGRQLVLKTYDAGIFKTDDVTKQACNDNLFALVGDGAVEDQSGITTRVGCGLPEMAAYGATTQRTGSANFFQPIPGTLNGVFNVGPCEYIKKQFPDAITKAAIVYTQIAASQDRAEADAHACEKVGFKFPGLIGIPFGDTNFQAIVGQLKSLGIKYFSMITDVPDTLALLREMKAQDYHPEVIDLGQQYYTQAVAAEPAAAGTLVLTNTVPFEEVSSSPALQVYETWRKKVHGPETSLGVQAFSAGLLFAQAAESLGNDLTRANLIAAVKKIHSWDAGGMQMEADPGGNVQNTCFLYLKVENGKFVRAYPSKGFACSPSYFVTIPKGS